MLMKYYPLIGRILFSAIFITAAPSHFDRATIQMASAHGVPAAEFTVPLAGIVALLGGLSVLLGYKSRLGAWLLVLFLVPVTLMMHSFWTVADPPEARIQEVMFMKNVALLGATFFIAYFGTGPISLDNRRLRTHRSGETPDRPIVAHS